jgi:uncharacterized protein (DUF433 family)
LSRSTIIAIVHEIRKIATCGSDFPLTPGTLAVSMLREYGSEMSERIEINPRVCGGQPVIKGTRIPVAAILEQLAVDESWDSLLRGYPELTRDDVQAALEYARDSILHTEITALGVA